ncbi:mitotic checkpoint protein BUB3.3-like [Malus domestica]|uniref:mitotic checkpoint protein BUB3.3-like n=1 Tax=Malus domestica TaxID=3750 RepID=UPI0007EE24E8
MGNHNFSQLSRLISNMSFSLSRQYVPTLFWVFLCSRYDLHSEIYDSIGNHDDIPTCVGYSGETSQLITAGLDRKILSWDNRTEKGFVLASNLDSEVMSMPLSGLDMVVAIGSSIYVYDLRNLEKPIQSKDSNMDVQIVCVSSIPYAKGFAVGSINGRVALEISCPSSSDDIRYMFRCHPKSTAKRYHLASVNDIAFNPLIFSAFVTSDNDVYVTAWDATQGTTSGCCIKLHISRS